jgi:hypothetical protein
MILAEACGASKKATEKAAAVIVDRVLSNSAGSANRFRAVSTLWVITASRSQAALAPKE